MSPFSDMKKRRHSTADFNDKVWKALADPTRRSILDLLAERPLTTGELVARFDKVCRTNVMKHINILVEANLIIVRREGRNRWNLLNPTPIQSVCDRWVSGHVKRMATTLSRLKEHVEERHRNETTNRKTHKQQSPK